MPRFAIGVTLTPQERALQRRDTTACGRQRFHPGASAALPLRTHTCSIALPDMGSCPVTYTRYSACSHAFRYEAPLHQKVWYAQDLQGGTSGVEQKAQELSPLAFAMAMAAEQKAMRRKSVPKGTIAAPDRECLLRSTTAEVCGGHYAACLKFSSGRLMPFGRPHDRPEQARADLYRRAEPTRLFPGQCLVVGICCRYLRMWVEPQFLPFPYPTVTAPGITSQIASFAVAVSPDETVSGAEREEVKREPSGEDAFVEEDS